MVLIRFECLIYFRIREFTSYDLNSKLKSIQNSALGRLIDMLRTFTDDDELIKELQNIKKVRDYVAHQSLLSGMNNVPEGLPDIDKLVDTDKATMELIERMTEKWKGLDEILNQVSTRREIDEAEQGVVANPYPL